MAALGEHHGTNGARLAIILGTPASGKTTLARRLSEDWSLPAFSKADIKETLLDVPECTHRETSRLLSEASFAALAPIARAQLAGGRSCSAHAHARLLRLVKSRRL